MGSKGISNVRVWMGCLQAVIFKHVTDAHLQVAGDAFCDRFRCPRRIHTDVRQYRTRQYSSGGWQHVDRPSQCLPEG